ncbi:MAG TPA: VPLPA-CTERM sorting domain-containing protein [Steroidobacteraceae bacterium]|nr:VPLPA-CTERM sorting domain-containing protein [Steroidobacteraceae bacterium]
MTCLIQRRLKKVVGSAGFAAALAIAAGTAHATTINGSLDTSAAFSPTNQSTDGTTYFNAPASGPFPGSAVQIGEFDFSVPAGETITSATLSGDFGSNTLGSGSAQVDLTLNGIAVASCDSACASASGLADVPWAFTFTAGELASLASGKAVLTAIQQSASQIVLDPTSVAIQTSPVPLPAAGWLLGSGLLSLAGLRRRKAAVATCQPTVAT